MRILFLSIIALIFINNASCQYYVVGQDPASVRWRYIKTDHFKIIYSDDFEVKAQEVANNMEHVYKYDRNTMKTDPMRCPIILHNKTIEPNGFTMWAPRRIEFYTCPAQSSYPEDWLKQLSIHEYRHYIQMSKLNQGFTKWMSWLLGEQGTGITLGLFEPTWFMEGDAVVAETAYSNSGRGRLPSFELELRSQVIDKNIYSYDKAIYGSYKDFVPDYYEIGYQIVAFARKTYGAKIWDSTLNIMAHRPFIITPFNKGIKNSTGLNKTELYKKTLTDLGEQWKKQKQELTYTAFNNITKNTDSKYWKYKYPAYINDSTIFAEKSGLDDIARFVAINKRTGKEKIIFTPGIYFTDNIISVQHFSGSFTKTNNNKPGTLTADNITLGKSLVVWTEKVLDKRWLNRSYSVIKILDLKTLKARTLTRKSRYFAPGISPDGMTIVASKVTDDNYYSLVLIDVRSGKEIKTIAESKKDFYITPSWTPDSKQIVAIILNNKGKRIDIINPVNKMSRTLVASSYMDLYNPKVFGKYVFYDSPYSGIDNIYASDTATGKVYQITSSKYGAYNADFLPTPYSQLPAKFVYSDYSANGFDLVEVVYKPETWVPLERTKDNSVKMYEALQKQENGNLDNDTVNLTTYKSKKYNKFLNLINLHSWAPAYLDVNNINIKPGLSLLTQNLLSTAIATTGLYYNTNEGHTRYFADISYAGFYPVFNLHYDYGARDISMKELASKYKEYNVPDHIRYFENNLNFNTYVPLDFSRGKYFNLIQPEIGLNYKILNPLITKPDTMYFHHENNTRRITVPPLQSTPSIFYELFAYNLLKTVPRDINSRWGQIIDVIYSHDPFHTDDKSTVFSSSATLYFPGFFRHHSFYAYGAYQYKTQGFVDYNDLIRLPYGFRNIDEKRINLLSVSYRLPMLYPDLSIGSLAYIKRLRGGLIYEYSTYNDYLEPDINKLYRTAGFELNMDLHILRFIAPIVLGVRTVYRQDINKTWFVEFLYAINVRDL